MQFSSAFCAPCRATKIVLDEVSSMVDGVAHVEVDAESHLELVRRLADRGLAVLIISHNMNDVFQVADDIAVLECIDTGQAHRFMAKAAIRAAENFRFFADRVHLAKLSAREVEVLRLVADGRSNRQIADVLHITEGTVKIHLHAEIEGSQVVSLEAVS